MTWRRRTTAGRGIKAVIPEPSDQAVQRKRRGSRGGRPVAYDTVESKRRAGIERGINVVKQWRGIATRYDKHALTTAAPSPSPSSSPGCDDFRGSSQSRG
jgi:transposase